MGMKRVAVFAATAAFAFTLTACGEEGTPTPSGAGNGSGAAPASDTCKSSGTTFTADTAAAVKGSPTFDKIKSAGKVVVGVKYDQPNLGYKDTSGTRCGFDIETAQYIASKLGVDPAKIEYKEIPSANRETAIKGGEIDYYVGTYSITDKRKADVSFAGPYFIAGQDLLVRKDESTITGKDTLKGKKVCSATGSTPIQRVRDEGLTEPENIVEFKTYSECVSQLLDKKVDAVTTDDAILKGYAAQNPTDLKVVGKPFSTEKYGIGLPHDDKALRDYVNNQLDAAFKDGTWQKIYDGTLGKSGSPATPPALERY
ncbi:ABC transporter substrate-binding protein [Actinoplanes ianthinogenes]|uniref:ABC transporter substrate-binding protein n=1 Tax=Actinoplanes ianthinogenes TaxID=122358 RepID=A0ABM7LSV1_9ACTN|nr:glutamate ABC transporter substrate-binding protein [Actinoplanes ianthinogenes]BCJ42341.1 ABC transporter substrate-binding protein [Actinoplanes ianthinogenes]GGR57653.1 ABC transporter substrate-binding protein [Actinoplanes ianthinogenes]